MYHDCVLTTYGRHFPSGNIAKEDMATGGIAPAIAFISQDLSKHFHDDVTIYQGGENADIYKLYARRISKAGSTDGYFIFGECKVETYSYSFNFLLKNPANFRIF